jgi:hypothetical protein
MKFNIYKTYLAWIPVSLFSLTAYTGIFHTFGENLPINLITLLIFISLLVSFVLRVFLSKNTSKSILNYKKTINLNEIISKEIKKNLVSISFFLLILNTLNLIFIDISLHFFLRSIFISLVIFMICSFWTKIEIEEQLIRLASENKITLCKYIKLDSFSKKLTRSILIVFLVVSLGGFIRDLKDLQEISIYYTGEYLLIRDCVPSKRTKYFSEISCEGEGRIVPKSISL